jgi:hypothetical protein
VACGLWLVACGLWHICSHADTIQGWFWVVKWDFGVKSLFSGNLWKNVRFYVFSLYKIKAA